MLTCVSKALALPLGRAVPPQRRTTTSPALPAPAAPQPSRVCPAGLWPLLSFGKENGISRGFFWGAQYKMEDDYRRLCEPLQGGWDNAITHFN